MPLKQKLTKMTTASEVVASYDTVDLLTNTGYINYYGVGMDTQSYVLTTEQLIAGTKAYVSGDYPRSTTGVVDNDFILTATTKGYTMGGECIITYSTSHGAGATIADLTFKFYKNADLLVTADVTNDVSSSANDFNAKVTIPDTVFNEGDVLTITAGQPEAETFTLYHDPSDTAAAEGGAFKPSHTILKFRVPHKLFI